MWNGLGFAPLKSPDADRVRILLDAVCHDCKFRHRIDTIPRLFGDEVFDWHWKHQGHNIEFVTTKRVIPGGFDDRMFMKAGEAPWYLLYPPNSNLTPALGAVTAFTITIASLATSATWVAGQQATAVANTGAIKNIDYKITAQIMTGTTPTVDTEIRLYGIPTLDDGPTWPDTFTATNAARTVTNTYILDGFPILQSTKVTATSNVAYPLVRELTVAEAFGICPNNFTVFLSQNTGANLNSGTQVLNYQGMYFTSTG